MDKGDNIKKILEGCLNKDAKSQRALVDKYASYLLITCKRYMNNDESAKDLVQDSFIKIFKNLEQYDANKGEFKSWITTLSIRLCLSKLRKRNLEVLSMDSDEDQILLSEDSRLTLDSIETKYLIEMIKELPDGYREVFNLAAIDGYSHKEIAEHLGIKEEISRTRLARARKKLRTKIENLNKEELWVNSI